MGIPQGSAEELLGPRAPGPVTRGDHRDQVRLGHGRCHRRVIYVTIEEFAKTAASTGAEVLQYESTWPAPATLPNLMTADNAAQMRLMLLTESIATVPKLDFRFAHDLPDGLVYDTAIAPAERMLARKWNRPAVQVFTGIASNEYFSVAGELAKRIPELTIDQKHPRYGSTTVGSSIPTEARNGRRVSRRFVPCRNRCYICGRVISATRRITSTHTRDDAADKGFILS